MNALRFTALIAAALLFVDAANCAQRNRPEYLVFTGLCDASAATAIDQHHFLVASDEDSRIRIYRNDAPGPPVQMFDLRGFLELDTQHPETDIEAAARVDDTVYWITSHGRNAEGKPRVSRERFFATRIVRNGEKLDLVPEGRPCKSLLAAMKTHPHLRKFDLSEAATKAPKDAGGLNIEGLASMPDGRLLIGFRNPVPDSLALIVPLLNPREVIAGAEPRLGDPIQVDLGGLGIRDMVWTDAGCFIIGGPTGGKPQGKVFLWDGVSSTAKQVARVRGQNFNPEAFVLFDSPGTSKALLLSDDGTRRLDGCPCKELKDEGRRQFRAAWVDLDGE